MSLNFFQQEQSVKPVKEFGIIDPAQNQSNTKQTAYVDYNNQTSWNTRVISNNRTDIKFNAIDGNIIFYKSWRENFEKQRSCDAMLYTSDTIIFLEIKDWSVNNKGKTFTESAIEQLENTIVHFCTAHPKHNFSKKYAYVSNKARPTFSYSNMNNIQKFKDNTNGFILYVGIKIILT